MMSPADPAGTNTLGRATSPYLRQHADNPVHWQQWTPQALQDAATRDVPILLSIGYAACHWCHVMAHESFEDDTVAAAMNAGFVCIKVDREERPDIDAVYMNATVALTGQGGWPMTCFLTPDGRPFYCGTYYPKDAFLQLLSAVADTWRDRRGEVEEASDHISGELRKMASSSLGLPDAGPEVAPALCDHAVATVLRDQDAAHGGFGGAPKFPPSALLEALLRNYERTGSAAALDALSRTGTAMARGGIYDQLAGGFARYSVDNAWVVPHFEKMLYDNALLLRAYAHWARRTGDPLARKVARQTARFLLDELGTKSKPACSPRRWTPTRPARRVRPTSGRRRNWPRCSVTTTVVGRQRFSASPSPARSNTARRCCSCGPIPTIRNDSTASAARCWQRDSPGPSPAVTTRSSRRGTGWRSPRWPRPAWRWQPPSWLRPRGAARRRCWTCTSSTGGCDGPVSAGWSATAPRSWRTTPCWPPGCWRCTS